jgi:hypothetical protein
MLGLPQGEAALARCDDNTVGMAVRMAHEAILS